jgi:hypothetical protein
MLQDLATVAPSVIVCVVFLVGVIALVRHEMAPKRKDRGESGPGHEEGAAREEREHTEL